MQLWSQIRFIYHQWASIANSESRISNLSEVYCKMCDVIEITVKIKKRSPVHFLRKKHLVTRSPVIVLLLFFRPDYFLMAFH